MTDDIETVADPVPDTDTSKDPENEPQDASSPKVPADGDTLPSADDN